MRSLGVGHDWGTSLSLFTFIHWRRKWQPTPVFLPGESQAGEPGGLLSLGLHRVGHDWSDLTAAAAVHYKNWINNSYLIYLLLTLVEGLRGDCNLNYNVLFLIFKNAKATDKYLQWLNLRSRSMVLCLFWLFFIFKSFKQQKYLKN